MQCRQGYLAQQTGAGSSYWDAWHVTDARVTSNVCSIVYAVRKQSPLIDQDWEWIGSSSCLNSEAALPESSDATHARLTVDIAARLSCSTRTPTHILPHIDFLSRRGNG